MTFSKSEAAALLHISESTLLRRTKAGQYKATRTGEGQFGKLAYTYEGLGLPTPVEPAPEPTPIDVHVAVQPEPVAEPEQPSFVPRPLSDFEKKQADDRAFARRYLAGEETDGCGNSINEKTCSLLGPHDPEPSGPSETQAHINPALMGNTPNQPAPVAPSAGCTRQGSPLAEGLSQEAYDEMMRDWRKRGGRRSEGEQEIASRRAVDGINRSFPTAPHSSKPTVR